MTGDLEAFVNLVRDYKGVIDDVERLTAHAFLKRCAILLPRLYSMGIELPDVAPNTQSADEQTIPSPLARLGALLGRYDSYLEVFDPYEEGEPVRGLISDDLADIYLDLVEPLTAFDSGRVHDAIWSWRFSLRGHGGDHIVDAMRAVHRLIHVHMPHDYVARESDAG